MRTHHPGTDNPPIRPSPKAGEIRTIHDDTPLWNDTPCCCEPEPRWQKVGEEMDRCKPQMNADERR